MKKKTILIFLFFATFIIGQNLEIKLEIEKTEYLQYEPISILLSIQNAGNNKAILNSITSINRDITANITTFNGENITPCDKAEILLHGQPVYDLMGGEEIFGRLSLMSYGNSCCKIVPFGNCFKPGEYTIEIRFNYYSKITHEEKEFFSNKQTIKIDKPTKDDEKLISDLEKLSDLKGKERIKTAIEIIDKYQKHPLTKLAYLYLSPGDMKKYGFDNEKYNKRFCIDYPNTIRAASIASLYIDENSKFKEIILDTKLYAEAIAWKENRKGMQKMMERNPHNKRILMEMKKRELQRNKEAQNEK